MKPRISDILLRCVPLCITVGLLSGCAAISGSQATADTFELASVDVTTTQSVRRGAQILIAEPTALKALDSENIVIETAPLTIQYLGDAQWSDRLPRVVQQKLASSFESANRFAGVGLPGQGLAIDYQLITEIRDFGIEAASNTAKVTISVKLLNDQTGNVVGSRLFGARATAAGTDPDAYVQAINAAFSVVSEDIVVWVASRL